MNDGIELGLDAIADQLEEVVAALRPPKKWATHCGHCASRLVRRQAHPRAAVAYLCPLCQGDLLPGGARHGERVDQG